MLECITLDDNLEDKEMMFRVMFNTAFIRSNVLMLNREEIDTLWNVKDQFPNDFRAEVSLCILSKCGMKVNIFLRFDFSLLVGTRFFSQTWILLLRLLNWNSVASKV